MVSIGGTPLLHKLVAQFRAAGVRRVVVIRGYAADKVHAPDVEFVENEDFDGSGELLSLSKAAAHLEGDAVLSFGDILFRKHILNNLLAEPHDIVIAVDAAWERRHGSAGYVDYVTATRPYSLRYDEEEAFLDRRRAASAAGGDPRRMDRPHQNEQRRLGKDQRRRLAELSARSDFRTLRFDDLFNHLIAKQERVQVLYITGHWLDVDDLDDLARAQAF